MSKFRDSRRRWLKQAGALASSASLPFRAPGARAESPSTLNALPRVALIIGNTKYSDMPLKNPGNDARAISGELQKVGFTVNLQLDAGRAQMAQAIQAFVADLAKSKGVGLFYYAGHGVQLAWRNYQIPVDAEIEKLEDVRTRAIELNALLGGMTKASNPMNVIMLDACRDNPFGTRVLAEQKGLSQFDAPPGSLLAYATSPGNTAADGTGDNGLYTENLLREIRVPDAKIEDILKRVRLNVRRMSQGRQIPWESTSLEDDFYFLPPQNIKKLSEAELTKQFEEELAIWEKIKASAEPEPLENYLREYPSGKFSELAQFRLDRLLTEKEEKRVAAETAAREAEERNRARLAEEKRIAEEKRLADERRLAEEKRIEAEKRIAEQRKLAEQKRLLDEQRIAKLAEEKRAAEEARLAEQTRLAEELRAAEEKRLAQDRMAVEEKARAAQLRLAEERRLAKLEEEQRLKSRATVVTPQLASVGPNPFSKGTARVDTRYRVGDSYSYREFDMFTKLETRAIHQLITQITDDQVIFSNGRGITDLLGNPIRNELGTYTGFQQYVFEYSIGKKWTTRFKLTLHNGNVSDSYFDYKVVEREKVTVPAGTFDAFRVEGEGWGSAPSGSVRLKQTYWIAPDIRRPVARELFRRHTGGKIISNERAELTAYRQQ